MVPALFIVIGMLVIAAVLLAVEAQKLINQKEALVEIVHDLSVAVEAEYDRATAEGRAQVHHWAVEVNSNIFYGNHPWRGTQYQRTVAALQDAEAQFNPKPYAKGGVVTNSTNGSDTVPVMIAPGEEYYKGV